jgi:hypothetical protein
MDEQGIMALPMGGMQGPTAQPMDVDPAAQAAFEQARLQMDPKEVGDELLAAGEQVDPAAVREFREAIQALRLPPEAIDALGQIVDAVLAEPQRYQEIRTELLAEGVPEDLLPLEFDAAFFGALNMALDQMSGMQEPMGVQGFADGGIVRLNPIAAGLARMGRNGDTMLAHITPAEARMLRRRGGSGTINPVTGLPEFFFKKAFKAIGKAFKAVGKAVSKVVKGVVGAVKKFASSTVGRIVVGAALGFFLGPAAASFLGVGKGTMLAAGINGFVGGFGSSILAGDNLKTALRNGALSGVTAGAVSGIGGAPFAGGAPEYASVSDALSGQVAAAKEGIGSFFGGQEPAPIETATPANLSAMASEGVTTPGDVSAMAPAAAASGAIAPFGQADYSLLPESVSAPSLAGQAGTGVSPAASGAMTTPTPQQLAAQSYTQTVDALGLPRNQFYPDIYNNALKAATPAVPDPTKLSAFGELGQAAQQVGDSQYMNALGSVGRAAFGTPLRATATTLGGLYMTGGFNQQQPDPLNIVPQETGSDLLRREPEVYGTSPGGAETMYFTPGQGQTTYMPYGQEQPGQNPFMYQAPQFQFRPPQYPRYAAQGGIMELPVKPQQMFANGGIAALAPRRFNVGGFAGGGPKKFPRRNGQIDGPGTGTSDDIPAMLSDGEFVMTAKAVRGAGNGSRREGAKRMYQMMHKLERMS